MKPKNETDSLNEAIQKLQNKQAYEFGLLKDQFILTTDGLKPINLIKNSLHDVITSKELKNSLIGNAIGLATGYLSKKVLVGSSHNPVKKLLGSILQFAVTGIVAKKADDFIATEENS